MVQHDQQQVYIYWTDTIHYLHYMPTFSYSRKWRSFISKKIAFVVYNWHKLVVTSFL
jgi:hypothetical protein